MVLAFYCHLHHALAFVATTCQSTRQSQKALGSHLYVYNLDKRMITLQTKRNGVYANGMREVLDGG